MSDLPDWVINLVAVVAEYEEEHAAVPPGTECLAVALEGVPHDVRFEARGWARARRGQS